jgi:ornithine carbamoyltransferase
MNLRGGDLLSDRDLGSEDVARILDRAAEIKAHPEKFRSTLQGKTLAMVFQKPSLRTRVTFETGMTQLGGHAIYISPSDAGLGTRESVPDVARNLERWVDGIMARVFAQKIVEDLARYSRVPVINGLSDDFHPVQALADFLTIREHFGDLRKVKLAYVGDGNNVCSSLLLTASRVGARMAVATPPGFEPNKAIVAEAAAYGKRTGASFEIVTDVAAAVKGAHAVYTDVWASMGQEAQAEQKARAFRPYQINDAVMAAAGSQAKFMHCLPAHRGEEVTDSVADSKASIIFDQAENRLHAQKSVMATLMGNVARGVGAGRKASRAAASRARARVASRRAAPRAKKAGSRKRRK